MLRLRSFSLGALAEWLRSGLQSQTRSPLRNAVSRLPKRDTATMASGPGYLDSARFAAIQGVSGTGAFPDRVSVSLSR